MKRRQFITLLGGAAAWPLAARTQQREQMRRIGVLTNLAENDPEGRSRDGAPAGAATIGLDQRPECTARLPLCSR
jgi:putative ABC transport system substrate-binding protein